MPFHYEILQTAKSIILDGFRAHEPLDNLIFESFLQNLCAVNQSHVLNLNQSVFSVGPKGGVELKLFLRLLACSRESRQKVLFGFE